MPNVFFQGSFELINLGHVRCLKRAKQYGTLIVGLNSNELIKSYKGRDPVLPWHHKKKILESIRYVDKVVKCNKFSCMAQLQKYKIDFYVNGKEWESTHQKEIKYVKDVGGKIVFLPRYKDNVSTSEIKKKLLAEAHGNPR